MKGRTLEEIDELFQNRVSRKDFPTYQCISSEEAKEVAHKLITGNDKNGEGSIPAAHIKEV